MADQHSNTSNQNRTENVGRLHRVSLIKGPHRWQFQWARGDELTLINTIASMARDSHCDFDWYDAAIVCKHIAQPFRGDIPDPLHPQN